MKFVLLIIGNQANEEKQTFDIGEAFQTLKDIRVKTDGTFPTVLEVYRGLDPIEAGDTTALERYFNKVGRALGNPETRKSLGVPTECTESQLQAVLTLCYICSTHKQALPAYVDNITFRIKPEVNSIELDNNKGMRISLTELFDNPRLLYNSNGNADVTCDSITFFAVLCVALAAASLIIGVIVLENHEPSEIFAIGAGAFSLACIAAVMVHTKFKINHFAQSCYRLRELCSDELIVNTDADTKSELAVSNSSSEEAPTAALLQPS